MEKTVKKVNNKRKLARKSKEGKVAKPVQPLSKRQELNNHIVCMRNTVQRARVQIINRINHQIQKYRRFKGEGKDLEKALRKADRLVEEIRVLTKVKKDIASLYALQDSQKLQDVLNRPDASTQERCLARLSHHPLIEKDVKEYRIKNPNWDIQIPVLLRMSKERKKPKKDKLDEGKVNNPVVQKTLVKRLDKFSEEEDVEEVTAKYTERSEEKSDNSDNDSGAESSSDEEHVHLERNSDKEKKLRIENRSKPAINHKDKSTDTNEVVSKPLAVDKSEGTVKVKFLKNLADLEESSEAVGEKSVDITLAPQTRRPKSGFFVGGVDRPDSCEDSRQQPNGFERPRQFNANNNNSKPVFKKGKLISKPQTYKKDRPLRDGRADIRFSGNAEPLGGKRAKFANEDAYEKPVKSFQQPEVAEKLHPSWEAKKKQQISLTAFQGKKITFNDDD